MPNKPSMDDSSQDVMMSDENKQKLMLYTMLSPKFYNLFVDKTATKFLISTIMAHKPDADTLAKELLLGVLSILVNVTDQFAECCFDQKDAVAAMQFAINFIKQRDRQSTTKLNIIIQCFAAIEFQCLQLSHNFTRLCTELMKFEFCLDVNAIDDIDVERLKYIVGLLVCAEIEIGCVLEYCHRLWQIDLEILYELLFTDIYESPAELKQNIDDRLKRQEVTAALLVSMGLHPAEPALKKAKKDVDQILSDESTDADKVEYK